MSKSKALCDWSKRDLRDRYDELVTLVASPDYVCLKYGRAATASDALCKPQPLGEKPTSKRSGKRKPGA